MKARIDKFKVKIRMGKIGNLSTLEELAKAANLGENTVYRSLDSYTWKASTLNAIARALDCNPKDLLTVDEEEDADTQPSALVGLEVAMA